MVDGWGWQLRDEGLGLLNPGVQLLVGLPELVDQDLGTLQACVALRVELAHSLVLLHQRLGFLLKKTTEKSHGEGGKTAQKKGCELEEEAFHIVIPIKAASGIPPFPVPKPCNKNRQ